MKLQELKSLDAQSTQVELGVEVLTEAYEDRVKAAVNHLVKKFADHHPTKEQVLSALHDYASPKQGSADIEQHHMGSHKPPATMVHGVPDYNGPTKTRVEFIKDVLAGVTDQMKFARVSSTGHVKPPKPAKDAAYYMKIFHTAEGIISNVFPDSDPIDRLGPWMRRNNISMDEVNRAFKKAGHKSYNDYLIDFWDQVAADAAYDAENGHVDKNSPFYDVEADGTIKPRSNPWK